MPIRVKTGTSTWSTIKKLWVKTGSSTWRSATKLFAKTLSGWVQMWPGDAPSVRLSDPINIRLGGYNGTIATSPQLFASTNQGTSGTFLKLWGNDGSFDGVTPITISNRRMLCSDNIDGQVERFSLSGNDTVDFATTSQATRDLAEGYYIFYQLRATNPDGELEAYSPPIKVIKRKPALVSTSLLSESGGNLTVSSLGVIEVNVQVRWGWWIRPGGYLGGTPVLRWWKNTSRSPGGTLLKEIDIETGYNYVSGSTDPNYIYDITSNVLTIYNNIGGGNSLQSGEYIIAELYLENSYTAHYAAPAIYWAATGAAAIPTITNLTALAPTTSSTQLVTVTVNWSSTNQASYFLNVLQTQVANYLDYGTTETSSNTSDSGSLFRVYSGASTTISLTVYSGPNQTGRSATQTITYTPPLVQQYTVTWSGTGGSTGNEGVPWEFTAGGYVTVPSVSRIGYTFERWADTSSGSYTYTTTGGTFYPPSQNITMYARWQINVCTVPNVIGMTEINASNALNNAGFLYEYTYYVDTSNASLNGTVQAVSPGVGTQPGCATNVDLYIYNYVAAPVKLATPTGVNATDSRTDGVNVTWNSVSEANYYGVWYGPTPSYDNLADFGGNRNTSLITGTSYLDTAIGSGVTRDYYVQAYKSGDPAGTKSEWGGPDSGTRAEPAPTITYGACTAYGSPYYTTSSYECYGTYSYAYTDNYYYQRRQILSNGTWNGSYDYSCGNTSVRTYGSISEVNGQCGFTAVADPTTPTGVSLTGSGAVSWNASSGSTSYDIQVYTATNSSGSNRLGPYVTTGISGTFYQLGPNEGYSGSNNYARVQVRGRNSAGAVSTYGGWVPSNSTYT